MNSLEEVRKAVKDAAMRHGFGWRDSALSDLPRITSDNMNFILTPSVDPASNWASGSIRLNYTVSASVSRMGGSPTVEELFQTADEIRRGAELVRELQSMGLFYIRKI